MKTSIVIAGYAESRMYPKIKDQLNYEDIKMAGWTHLTLCSYHIDSYGNISFNDKRIVQAGTYCGSIYWPGMVGGLKNGGKINTLSASVGGIGLSDFSNIQAIYEDAGKTFTGTDLEENFRIFKETFPSIDLIDLDCNDNYDPWSFVAFCKMLINIGFDISFRPYTNPWSYPHFWVNSLNALERYKPGSVKWWNLKCFGRGRGNDPQYWANTINNFMPHFNTDGFIIAGDKCPGTGDLGAGTDAVLSLLNSFKGEPALGGAFIWNLDNIVSQQNDFQSTGIEMKDYVHVISSALNSVNTSNKLLWHDK